MNRAEAMKFGGYNASFLINTKGKGYPAYLREWIADYSQNGVAIINPVIDMSHALTKWVGKMEGLRPEHTLLQAVLSFKELDLTEDEFTENVNMLMVDTVIPFLVGCDFDIMGVITSYYIPPDFRGMCCRKTPGQSITFHEKANGLALKEILSNVFGMTVPEVEEIISTLGIVGKFTIYDCIATGDESDELGTVVKLLEHAGISDYTINNDAN